MVRIGLVGCGAMGMGHVDCWSRVPCAKVTAVCDSRPDVVADVAARLGARPFNTVADMVASSVVDAVDICTPSGLHASQALPAAERGIHILCEKPLDLSLERVDRLLAACRASGSALGCVYQRRAYRGAQRVAEAVHSGRMGRVLSVSAAVKWWRDQSYYDSSAWRGTWALDGGVLANQAIHALDHMCWLAGRVVGVPYASAGTIAHRMEAEDRCTAVLRFESGAEGVIEATTACRSPLCSRLELYCENGSVAFDDAVVVHFTVGDDDLMADVAGNECLLGGRAEPMAISLDGHDTILRDFAEALEAGRPPMMTGEEGRKSVEALNLVYSAALPNTWGTTGLR